MVQGVVTSPMTCVDLCSSIRPWSTDLSKAVGHNPQLAFRKVAEVSSSVCWIAGRLAMTTTDSGGNGQQQRFRAGAMLWGFCWKEYMSEEQKEKSKRRLEGKKSLIS